MLLVLGAAPIGAHLQAQHVHGEAMLDIGIEGRTGTLEFRVPGEDLYGFEHMPRTSPERDRRDAALALLRSRGMSLARFHPALRCKVTPEAITSSTGKHIEVRARYRVACQHPIAGRDVGFGITAMFPSVVRVRVQLVSDTAQAATTVVRDRGVVRP
ncbi:MAG TPA: DUF2796 domain-containing protein [Gemmatimonas sp.]|nr:DUF2796 domain-containing protein [Gemmatimonas sp.]